MPDKVEIAKKRLSFLDTNAIFTISLVTLRDGGKKKPNIQSNELILYWNSTYAWKQLS
jgi:hypothetical protein